MKTTHDIVLFKANTAPIQGRELYWVLSKQQMEYILSDINLVSNHPENLDLQRVQYLDEQLPVLCLEKYFSLEELPRTLPYKYMVTKTVPTTGAVHRSIIRVVHPVRIRDLSFTAEPLKKTPLRANKEDILGLFTAESDQLLAVPDFAAILGKLLGVQLQSSEAPGN